MKIFIDVDQWGFASTYDKDRFFSRHTPGNSGVWNDVCLETNYKDADVVVCFDSYCKNHHLNGKKLVQVRQEPDFIQKFSRYAHADVYVDNHTDTQATFWFIDKPYSLIESLKYSEVSEQKNKNCSAIFTSKHNHRNAFFSQLSKEYHEIDFYGKSISNIVGNNFYKGVLNKNGLCKLEGLQGYEKSIAVENSSQSGYFTEKIVDCFISWTLPIYWGCPDIENLFPRESVRIIDLRNIPDCIEKIKEPISKIEIEAIGEARQMAMKKYNFWAAIERAVERL